MQIHAIHIMPFDFVQIVELRTGGRHSLQLLVELGDTGFQLVALVGEQPELGHIALRVAPLIVVAKFRWGWIQMGLLGKR